MTSWFAANPVPSYIRFEFEPNVNEPPYFEQCQQSHAQREDYQGSTHINPDHDSLVLPRRARNVDVQVKTVLTLSTRRRRGIEEGNRPITCSFRVVELLDTSGTVFRGIERFLP